MRPKRSTASATTPAGPSSAQRSAATLTASAPVAVTAASASARRSLERPTRTTWLPASPRARAISAPMPELAPVTTATVPWRSKGDGDMAATFLLRGTHGWVVVHGRASSTVVPTRIGAPSAGPPDRWIARSSVPR